MATVKPLIRYSDTGKVEEVRVGDVLSNTSGGTGSDETAIAFFLA